SGDYYMPNPKRKPRSPEQALQMSREDGTHSIMDMLKVSIVEAGRFKCEVATICPLPKPHLGKLFGHARPTRAMVDAYDMRLALSTFQPRGSAVWIKVYEGATP